MPYQVYGYCGLLSQSYLFEEIDGSLKTLEVWDVAKKYNINFKYLRWIFIIGNKMLRVVSLHLFIGCQYSKMHFRFVLLTLGSIKARGGRLECCYI